MYVPADIQIKERAMAKTAPVAVSPSRYRPNDKLLAFLEETLIMPTSLARAP